MISSSESYRTVIMEDYYVVLPEINISSDFLSYGTNFMEDGIEYSSGSNELISNEALKKLIEHN